MIALFLVMWPLSWYQFCVSFPLELRTGGLVLFLQVPTLLSVLHCLPPAGHVEPVFIDSVFSVASCASQNNGLHNTEKKVFATCAAPVPCYTQHDLLSLETAATPSLLPSPQIARLSHLGIERNVPRKPRRSRRGGKDEWRKIKVIVVFVIDFHLILPALQPPVASLPSLTFHRFSSVRLRHSDTAAVPPASPPSDRDDLTASSLGAPLRPHHRQLLHIPLVLPQPKTHSLSASALQDPSALSGGPTYPPSFRRTTSTSCC